MNRRPPAKTLSELGPDAETYARTGSLASLALGFGALATAIVVVGIAALTSWEQGQRIDALETLLTQTQAVVEANSIAASRIGTLAQDASIAVLAKAKAVRKARDVGGPFEE